MHRPSLVRSALLTGFLLAESSILAIVPQPASAGMMVEAASGGDVCIDTDSNSNVPVVSTTPCSPPTPAPARRTTSSSRASRTGSGTKISFIFPKRVVVNDRARAVGCTSGPYGQLLELKLITPLRHFEVERSTRVFMLRVAPADDRVYIFGREPSGISCRPVTPPPTPSPASYPR